MLKVDALGAKQLANLFERDLLSVDAIGGLALAVDGTGNLKLGTLHDFIIVRLILIIVNVLEVNSHCGVCTVLMMS